MRESELLKTFKISVLTLRNIYPKLVGGTIMERGRISYNLKPVDTNLLACAQLDAYTFRENRSKKEQKKKANAQPKPKKEKTDKQEKKVDKVRASILPFHRYLVYKVLTEPSLDVIVKDIEDKKLLNVDKTYAVLIPYIKDIIQSLPVELRHWIKDGQDLPENSTSFLESTMAVLDFLSYYYDPKIMFNLDFIAYDTAVRHTIEVLLTTRHNVQHVADYIRTVYNVEVDATLIQQYKHIYYDPGLMTDTAWAEYFKRIPVIDAVEKKKARKCDMVSYLLSDRVYEGIEFNSFLKKSLEDLIKEYRALDDACPLERAKAIEAIMRTIFLIHENIPTENKVSGLLSAKDNRMKEASVEACSLIESQSETQGTII